MPVHDRTFKTLRRAVFILFLLAYFDFAASHAQERIFVPARINGTSVKLAFDTGATSTVLLRQTVKRLGLSVTEAPRDQKLPAGMVPLGITEACELNIGSRQFFTRLRVVDSPSYLPTNMDGVLGWGSMKSNIFQIDAVRLEVSTLPMVPDVAKGWFTFPLRAEADLVIFEIGSGQTSRAVVVDTGFDQGVALSSARWRQWKELNPQRRRTVSAGFMPGAGLVVSEEAWAERIELGPLSFTNVPVTSAWPPQEALGSPRFEAVLGLAALRKIELIIDGTRGVAHVKPKLDDQLPASGYDHNRLGAVFAPATMEGHDLVARVAKLSPAEEAGIRDGDLLLRINGLDVTKWKTEPGILPLSRFWNQPAGSTLKLQLSRAGREYETVVTLRTILGP